MKLVVLAIFISLIIAFASCKKDEYALPCTCKAMYLWERRYKDSIDVQSDPGWWNGDGYDNTRPKYVYTYHWDTVSSPIYNNTPDYPFYCKDTFSTEYYLDTITPHVWIYDKRRLFCID